MDAPTTVEELAEAVRTAYEHGEPQVPWGAGTRQHLGSLPSSELAVLHVNAVDRLVAHVPADMTVTVEAGMTLGVLQQRLHAHNQWLPWNPPAPREATIGGLLASAASGPLRLGYGTPRDWVLGMRVVLGDGRIVKSGGNVVKNVAGYDLHKLHIGALGTLGVIAEVTMRVFPLLETAATVSARATDLATAIAYAEALRTAPLAPVSLVVASNALPGFEVLARYEGVEAGVLRQIRLAQQRVAHAVVVQADSDVWTQLAQFAQPHALNQTVILRAGAAPVHVPFVLAALRDCAPDVVGLIGYVGVGVAYARWPATADLAAQLQTLRTALEARGGYVVVEYAPAPFNRSLDLWGTAPPTLALMRSLKQKWDPRDILNRGRYLVF